MRLTSASDTQGWHLRFDWGTSPDDKGHLRAVYAAGPGLSEHANKPLIAYSYEEAAPGSGHAFLMRGTDAYGRHIYWSPLKSVPSSRLRTFGEYSGRSG